ncbi:hypothetical protein H0H87_009083, partial [Tephrocybe sp. NHM501043]
ATQKEDMIFPPLNLDGLENLITATNNSMDKDALSSNMMVTKKSNLVLREGATCPPLTLDGLENPVATANTPIGKDPSSPNMMVSKTSKESLLFDPSPPAIKEMEEVTKLSIKIAEQGANLKVQEDLILHHAASQKEVTKLQAMLIGLQKEHNDTKTQSMESA